MTHITTALGTFILFIALDYLWIGVLMKDFYLKELGTLARTVNGSFSVSLPAAIGVYILLVTLLMIFVFPKITTLGSALSLGFLFGFAVYGVYDLTNYATLTGWSPRFMVVDMLWGGTVTALVTVSVTWAKTLFS